MDLFVLVMFLFAGLFLSFLFNYLFFARFCKFLDKHFDSIHYDETKNFWIEDALGDGVGIIIICAFVLIPFSIISFAVPYFYFDFQEGFWAIIMIICFFIPLFFIFLKNDIFVDYKTLSNGFEISTPKYNRGRVLLITIFVMGAFVIFGLRNYVIHPDLKFILYMIFCILVEIVSIYISNLNKYLPIKIMTDEDYKYFSYVVFFLIFAVTYLILSKTII